MDRQPNKQLRQEGISLNGHKPTRIDGSLRPLGDRIVVEPLPVPLSTILIAERNGSFRGTVRAVGPGEYSNVYNRDRSKVRKSRVFRPTELRCGDIVELGGHEHAKGYEFPRITLNGVECVVASEKDVAAVHELQPLWTIDMERIQGLDATHNGSP